MALMALLSYQSPQDKYGPLDVQLVDDPAIAISHEQFARKEPHSVWKVGPTGSMEPTLHGDDYVLCAPVPYATLKEGDIINYTPKWANGKTIIHRLVLKDKGGWIASGDHNARSESWERVTEKNYVDKLVRVYRKKAKTETLLTAK